MGKLKQNCFCPSNNSFEADTDNDIFNHQVSQEDLRRSNLMIILG